MPESLPAAVYGKHPPDGVRRAPQGYRWVARHPGVPEAVVAITNRLVASFQWDSTPYDTRHAPVAAWVPANRQGSAGVFIRFCDAGEDDGGRPHTVRAEIVYLDDALLKEHPTLPWVLFAKRESLRIEDPAGAPRMVIPPPADTGALADAFHRISHAPLARTLVLASEQIRFRADIPEGTVALSAQTLQSVNLARSTVVPTERNAPPIDTIPRDLPRMEPLQGRGRAGHIALTFSWVLIITLMVYSGYMYHNFHTLDMNNTQLEEEKDELEKRLSEISDRISTLESEKGKLESEIDEIKRDREEFDKKNHDLTKQLEEAKDNLNEYQKTQIDKLNTIMALFRDVRDYLKKEVDQVSEQTKSTDFPLKSFFECLDEQHQAPEGSPRQDSAEVESAELEDAAEEPGQSVPKE